jgi:hypothetical protein
VSPRDDGKKAKSFSYERSLTSRRPASATSVKLTDPVSREVTRRATAMAATKESAELKPS